MSFWTKLLNAIKKLISGYNNIVSTTSTTTSNGTTPTNTTTTPIIIPSGKLLTAFLLPGKPGSKYTNSAGRDSTLCMFNDGDRIAMDAEREYIVNYLQSIKANCLPMIICNTDTSKDSYVTPFSGGWGSDISGAKSEYVAWLFYSDNDPKMFGKMCSSRGISQIPILFCSEDRGGPFSNPSWAEKMIKDLVPYFITHGNVKWICTHLEAEKFVTPDEVNRIAGLVKKYMPGVGTMVHCTNTSFAKCDVDAVCVQCDWHPRDGDLHQPQEVVDTLQGYLNDGARKVIAGEYNWNSEGAKAKAQGQAALTMSNCIGAWCGW